jgi:YfiH family protein
MSWDPGVALTIRSADCVPILLADPVSGVAGAAHAGWRGTAAAVVSRLVERLSDEWGCPRSRLVALLGPAIGPCCYDVREDVASAFRERFPDQGGFLRRVEGEGAPRQRLDLVGANTLLLRKAGLAEESVMEAGLCTACRRDLFPSYRAEGESAGRFWSVIGPRNRVPQPAGG